MTESNLQMARRHVAEGERRISKQRKTINDLRTIGASTDLAEQLLVEFESIQTQSLEDLERFEAEAARRSR